MHPRILDERATAARKKLASAAERLAERLDIPALEPIDPRDTRDPAVFAMRELEVIAELMDRAARKLVPPSEPEIEAEPPAKKAKR